MTGIRTSTFATAVLGVGLIVGACASPAAKTAAPVAPSAQSAAQTTRPPADAPAAPGGQALPVVHVAPATPPASSAVANTTPSAPAAPVARTPPSATAAPVASTPPSAPPVVTTTALPPSVPSPSNATIDAVGSPPHFTTPDAAMRYLVAAYNLHDLKAEMHVTTPDSRAALENERQWVNTFSFHSCTLNPGGGDYSCQFDMVSKVKTTDQGTDSFGADIQQMGEITVLVAPAQRPGWYMYYNEGCGG